MKTFEEDFKKAIEYHGHICAGQVLGVRLARLALKTLGIDNPEMYKDLIAYVEADRCVADAVCCVTDCKIGRRRLKWVDYGKMAASFVNLADNRAIRVSVYGDHYVPEGGDPLEFFSQFSDEQLFKVKDIKIDLKPEDLPGKPLQVVTCDKCGERIFDKRQVEINGKTLCRACANGAYYEYL